MSDTIILHEMVPKWNRLFKQKGEFRQIRWCEVHDCPPGVDDENLLGLGPSRHEG